MNISAKHTGADESDFDGAFHDWFSWLRRPKVLAAERRDATNFTRECNLRFARAPRHDSVRRVTGAILNATGIIVGSIIGLARSSPLTPQSQAFFKVALGTFTIFYGLRLTWVSVGGSFPLVMKQIVIAFLAVLFGKWIGKLMHFQPTSNRAGQYARELIEQTQKDGNLRFSNGLNACAILFCASPLGILGAIHDGLPNRPDATGYCYPLAVKAVMDGLAMMSFVRLFGAGCMLCALPVFLLQGTLTLACLIYIEPFLRVHGLLNSVNAVGGLIICTIGMVIFEVKRVELADFLPALAVAPLITWLWK
jgi:uncharacterized membrane protein YqgA involved in biofilm formation